MTAVDTLKQYFGYETFREGQRTLIDGILSGKDVFGIMPTGAGKSICFQVPALMSRGVTLVVSPLISLMKDQVNALTQAGVPAAFINSSLTASQMYQTLRKAENGQYKLIYVAPERLFDPEFNLFAQSANVTLLTVDEAHCISQWGQDFRPSYAKIPEFIRGLPKRPIVSAFTATATEQVRKDVQILLDLHDPIVLVTGFDRKNLYFEVQKPKDKFAALLDFLQDKKQRFGIVYCTARDTVEELCDRLNQEGHNASRYHAGLNDFERQRNQNDFLYDRAQIMVATNAFGMGIDKSNVSFVVHYNMPKDLESYYQEAGRAGRDGEPAECVLLYSAQDVRTNSWMIENSRNVEQLDEQTEQMLKQRDRRRLRVMEQYCQTGECLRRYILEYFGENPPDDCGNCGNCNEKFQVMDVTIDAQKILSCVAKMRGRFGQSMMIDVLCGKKSKRLQSYGLDKLSTYGISKDQRRLHDVVDHLVLSNFLIKTDDEFPVLKLGQRAYGVLRGQVTVQMKFRQTESPETEQNLYKSRRAQAVKSMQRHMDEGLYDVLKQLRLTIANEQGVPAFVIFSNSTLVDMCAKTPATEAEFLRVSGVGQVKLQRYGARFLQCIANYIANKTR